METDKSKAFSFTRRMAGWLLLGLVILVSIAAGILVSGLFFHPPARAASNAGVPFAALVLLVAMGFFFSFIGLASYIVILLTNCFTFNYSRPVWLSGFTMRLRIANIFVPLFLILGAGSFVTAVAGLFLAAMGITAKIALLLPFFAVLVPAQFFLAWFNIWTPIDRTLIGRRLSALGISPERMGKGIYAGISDPSVNSFSKGLIEDDVGMLWIEPGEIVYQGDARRFVIGRDKLVRIEREVDKGSVAAYAGAVYVILVWLDEKGVQNRTRLHVMTCYTLTGIARALDRLAVKLENWKMQSNLNQ